ncbi:hypothetical protein F4810DRAFT_658868 [Camillea tinctor]|nr:hypothetical protein F4810DRAFT_658868 [Camillea tinctor]
MSILCCRSPRRNLCRELDHIIPELPKEPPPAKLSGKPPLLSETDIIISPMAASRAASLLNTPTHQDTVDPTTLDVDDSDDDAPMRHTGKSSIGTLESIKTRLIRRISHKSDAKRYSQQSLGNSDEEIARRAELKRLMRKRIQDELKSEEQDGHIRSSCPDEPVYDNCPEPELPGGGPRDTLEFAVSQVETNDAGDVDNISIHAIPLAFPADKGPGKHLHLPRSCPGSAYISRENSVLDGQLSMTETDSLPQLPSSPHLAPVYFPATRESDSIHSWSLSYNASHLVSYFGPWEEHRHSLSSRGDKEHHQEEERSETSNSNLHQAQETSEKSLARETPEERIPIPGQIRELLPTQTSHDRVTDKSDNGSRKGIASSLHDTSDDRCSPLDIWLRSQDLQSNSFISSRPNSSHAPDKATNSDSPAHRPLEIITPSGSHPGQSSDIDKEMLDYLPGAWPQSRNISPSTEPDLTTETPSIESIAPRKGASKVTSTPCPNFPSSESIEHEPSSKYTSSRYTTQANSLQPTPKESRLNLTEAFGGRKIVTPFLSFYRLATANVPKDTEKSSSSSYQTAPNKEPTPDLGVVEELPPKRPTIDTGSVTMSDTASFRQREAELISIEKRFGLTSLHRAPSFPVCSKFREEFDQSGNPARGRHSFFTRLRFSMPKKESISSKQQHKHFDGALHNRHKISTHGEEHWLSFQEGVARKQPSVSSSMGYKPHIAESATGLWQRAIKSEADNRRAELDNGRSKLRKQSPNIHITEPERQGRVEDEEANEPSVGYNSLSKESGHNLTPKTERRLHSSQKQPENASNGVLREWVNQLDADDPVIQSGLSAYSQTRKSRKLLTPPASWSKWPSHSRHERTGPAGVDDNVNSKDFANFQVSQSPEIPHAPEKSPTAASKRSPTPLSRSLSSHFSKAMKEGWGKVAPRKDGLNRDRTPSITPLDDRKSRGYLEYPELELLPTPSGYKEVQALEQQIDTIKRYSSAPLGSRRELSRDSTRPSLTTRLVEHAHQLQSGNESSSSPDMENLPVHSSVRTAPTQLDTLPASRTVSGAAEEFGTPQSHISYEDCVPTHMLDEDDDNSRMSDAANTDKHPMSENGLNRLETEQIQQN